MTIYVVYSGGSGAGGTATTMTPSAGEWSAALTTLTAVLALATPADTILIAHDHAASTASAVSLTFPSSPGLRAICVDRTTGALAMTATEAVGAANAALTVTGFGYIYGLGLLGGTNNSNTCDLNIATGTIACGLVFDHCALTMRTASSTASFSLGPAASTGNDDSAVTLSDTTLKFSSTSHSIDLGGTRLRANGLILDGSGSAPTTLFSPVSAVAADVAVYSSDLSGVTWTNLLAFAASRAPGKLKFSQCRFPSGWVPTTGTGAVGMTELEVFDCNSGDVHTFFGYYTGLGSVVSDTATYLTAGPAGQAWKITTTAAVTACQPFCTPWINQYNSATASVTPYIECLRNNGTASAYDDDEVWAEIAVKTDAGFANSIVYSDWLGPIGTPSAQAAGVGTGSWTIGASSSPYSFKCDTGAAVTPDETGHIRGRLCVGLPSIAGTLYMDPVVRW